MKLPNSVNPSADNSPKIGHDFSNKEVQNGSYQKIVLIKNVSLN